MKKLSVLVTAVMLICTASVCASEHSFCKMSGTQAAIRGRSAGVGNEEVTLLLMHKEDDIVGYAAQPQTNDDGYYKFDFKFTKDNPENYRVIVNRAGEVINETITEARITGSFFIDLSIDYDGKNGRVSAFLSECFGSGVVKVVLAQYDSEGKLVSVKTESTSNINGDGSLIVEDISTSGHIKGFAWSDLNKMQSLSETMECATIEVLKKSEENSGEAVKIACPGDSITWGHSTTKQYHSYMSDELMYQYKISAYPVQRLQMLEIIHL